MNDYLESFKKNLSLEDANLFAEYEKTFDEDSFDIKYSCVEVVENVESPLLSAETVEDALENLRVYIEEIQARKENLRYHSLFFSKQYDCLDETDYLCVKGRLLESYDVYSERVYARFLEYKDSIRKRDTDYQLYIKLKQQFEGV